MTNLIVVPFEFRNKLKEVLNDFSGMITSGNKVNAVNNATLKIRLEKDVVINRPPYRLSASEK